MQDNNLREAVVTYFLHRYERSFLHKVGIRGIGAYVPEARLSNYDLEKMVDTTDEWIVRKIGIKERRIAKSESILDMAEAAAIAALKNADINPAEIDLVIVATVSCDYKMPSLANKLTDRLEMKLAAAFDMNSGGCAGFVYSLITGAKYIDGHQINKVLCVSVEKQSAYVNWKDRSTCVFFGDGAGAVVLDVLTKKDGFLSYDIGSFSSEALLLPSVQIEGRDDTFLRMDGRKVWEFATTRVPRSIIAAAHRAGIRVCDIDLIIFHQANLNIIKNCMEQLEIPLEKTHLTIERFGNTGGPSICITLAEAIAQGKVKEGDIIALAGFGGGLSWATVIFQWLSRKEYGGNWTPKHILKEGVFWR